MTHQPPDTTIIRRVLEHVDARTTGLGDRAWREPVENDRSAERFARELEPFRTVPTVLCASAAIPAPPPEVCSVLDVYPSRARDAVLALRAMVFEVAASIPGVAPLEETLKWGEPAFLTPRTRAGTTLRLAWKPAAPEHCSILVSCNSRLIAIARCALPGLVCVGNREVRLTLDERPPAAARDFAALALAYKKPHLLPDRLEGLLAGRGRPDRVRVAS